MLRHVCHSALPVSHLAAQTAIASQKTSQTAESRHTFVVTSKQYIHTGDRRSRLARVVTLSTSYMSLSLAVVEGAAPVTTSCFRALTRALKELPPLMSMRFRAAPPNTIFSCNTPKKAVKSNVVLPFPAPLFLGSQMDVNSTVFSRGWYIQVWFPVYVCGM